MLKRGEIYLIDFGKRYQSNIGKVRPAVIFSSNDYLQIVEQLEYPTLLVIPLTTNCVDNPKNLLRVQIKKRDTLAKNSEAIVNWSCSVDYKNINIAVGAVTSLDHKEIRELDEKYTLYCGLPANN